MSSIPRSGQTILLLLFVLTGAVYLNSLNNGFTFDDEALVVQNTVVHEGSLQEIFSSPWWPGHPERGLYRPLSTLTLAFNYKVWGLDPFGYHLLNVLLHMLNGSLVFWVAFRVLGDTWGAAITALVFALHPIQTEAVNGIVGRAELLATFWVLASWALYIGASERRGRMRGRLYVCSLAACLLGCLSKEHAAVTVGILGLYDLLIRIRQGVPRPAMVWLQRDLKRYVPFVLVVLLFLALRHSATGAILIPVRPRFVDNPLAHFTALDRIGTALIVQGKYLALFLLPSSLSADYSHSAISPVVGLLDARLWLALVLLAGMVVTIAQGVLRRWDPIWGFSFCFLGVCFFPTSNILFPIGTIMGERLAYLSTVGFGILVGALALQWRRSRFPQFAYAVPCFLLIAYSVRTYIRNPDWKDNFALFSSAVVSVPSSAKAHFNLGNAFRDRGQPRETLNEYGRALQIYPEYAEVHYTVGVVFGELGRTDQAAEAYSRALVADSLHVSSWMNLGAILGRRGQYGRAAHAFECATKLAPDRIDARFNYALACQELGQSKKAAELYVQILSEDPGYDKAAINLGALYSETGYLAETIAVYKRLLSAKPDAFQVAYNLAVLLEKHDRLAEAAESYRTAGGDPGEMGGFALFKAGDLYRQLGQVDSSRDVLEVFLHRWTGDRKYRDLADRMLAEMER